MKRRAELGAEELATLVRRGRASSAEERRFGILLKASPVEKCLFETGQAYDLVAANLAGDEELIDRVIAGISTRRGGRGKVRWRAFSAGIIVGVVSLSVVAAAFTLDGFRSVDEDAQCAGGLDHMQRSKLLRRAGWLASETVARWGGEARSSPSRGGAVAAVPRSPASDFASDHVEGSGGADKGLSGERTGGAEGTPLPVRGVSANVGERLDSAAARFAAANTLRKQGQLARARSSYQQLQNDFPRSREAILSFVILGRMFLQRGDAQSARHEFARYLALSPRGALAEEALYGQASALRQCGLRAGERESWCRLLEQYPSSIYARVARKRLQELD